MNHLYLTESVRTYCLHMLYEYWDENIHPTHMIIIYGLICFINILMDFRYVNPLKMIISRGSQNNKH